MVHFHHFGVFTRCRFQNVPVRAPFSKSTVFKICRQKICRFRVNGRPIRHIFHRFQNVPASCERSLRLGGRRFYSPKRKARAKAYTSHCCKVNTLGKLAHNLVKLQLCLDRIHTMAAHFENGEKCDGWASLSLENCIFFAGRFWKRKILKLEL